MILKKWGMFICCILPLMFGVGCEEIEEGAEQ